MDNLSMENVEDMVEKDEKISGKEFLQRCQSLQDVESSMYQKNQENINPNIKYRYSKEELLKLKTHPLSIKPLILQENLKFLLEKSKPRDLNDLKSSIFKKNLITRSFDGVNDKVDLKKNEISRNGEKSANRNDGIDEARKSADPKERIRKEQDICLSPQRKSFNTGCYVANAKIENAANNNGNGNNNSNNNKMNADNTGREPRDNRDNRDNRGNRDNRDNRDKNFREGSRRIGSGRIISRDPRHEIHGYPDSSSQFNDYPCNRSFSVNKEIPTVIYERRFPNNSFDREKDNKIREKDNNKSWDWQRSFNHYDKRRYDNRRDDEEEEPEWMKDGPISQDDVIDLRGFDENDEKWMRNKRDIKNNTRMYQKSYFNNSYNKSTTNGRNRTDKRNSDSDNSSVASDSLASKNNENSSNKGNEDKKDDAEKSKNAEKTETKETKDAKNVETNSIQFNLEEILKLDPLPDISENVDNESAGSKFTRWFKRDDTHSSAMNGEQNPGVPRNTIIFSSSNLPVNGPGELVHPQSSSDFNPHSSVNNSVPASNLLDLLRGSQDSAASPAKMNMRVLEASGKLHSLEEIEAKLRGTDNAPGSANGSSDKKKKEEETEAFKKLLSQAFHVDKTHNDGSSADVDFVQKMARIENIEGKIDLASAMCNGENHANLSTNFQPQIPRIPPQMNNMQQSTEMLKLLQLQQNKQQQEMLSKMLMSNSSANFPVPPPTNIRPSVSNSGPFPHITPEIQVMINAVQPTRELMQRQETKNIIKALKTGEASHYQLVEQLKKTDSYQAKFRESLLCVLKMMQMQYYNSAPVLGSPAGMSFSMPPPPPPVQPYTENILQQMMMNSQYRANGPHNGMPNIVYQRDFSSPNQNVYQNNVIKKHLVEQSLNLGQNVARMNSPTNVLSSPGSISMSGNNITNATNSIVSSQDDKNNAVLSTKSTSTIQSLSFTPTSVLRKLSAEKENMDTFSKEIKESKGIAPNGFRVTGEKNTVIPYTSNANSSSNVYVNQGAIDHFNGFGTCIPPPAISGQYFVGNMIRPASISTQVPIFGSPPPPVLSRLPVPSNSTVLPRGQPKVPSSSSQLQQLQMKNSNSQIAQMIMNSNFNLNSRMQTDANLPMTGFGNQNLPSRNAPLNGTLSSAEEQMARWFSSDGVNQSRSAMAQNIGMPTASLQNMMSVDEIERVQQSVRN